MPVDTRLKPWRGLGLGTLLVTGALAGCSQPAGGNDTSASEIAADAPSSTAEVPAANTGEGEAGFGGEGEGGEGEGGVAISAAYTDPVVYNSALAITAAHVIAARDAFAAGETEAAAEMFAHPVSEVLFDMDPVFTALGVADFSDLLTNTSAAVLAGENADQINARTDGILAALRAASAKAPQDGTSPAMIRAGVAADQINRAADMYRAALETDRYEPYLDGYGFYKSASLAVVDSEVEAENPDAAEAIRNAMDLLAEAYPGAKRPEVLTADPQAITVAAAEVLLALSE